MSSLARRWATRARLPNGARPSPGCRKRASTTADSAFKEPLDTSDWKAKGSPRWTGTTYVLAFIPVFTFGLGTWQVKRLFWKRALIEDLNDKMARDPMALPKNVKSVFRVQTLRSHALISSSQCWSRTGVCLPKGRGQRPVRPLKRDPPPAPDPRGRARLSRHHAAHPVRRWPAPARQPRLRQARLCRSEAATRVLGTSSPSSFRLLC